MLVLEYKLVANSQQEAAMVDAIRAANFIRNKCLRLWMDGEKIGKYQLSAYCVPLSKEFEWAGKLNSQARQAAAERTWSSVARFYKECTENSGRIAYPKFKKRGHSVEYKTTGWKLSEDRRHIAFTDGFGIGKMKLIDKRRLNDYPLSCIKRVRIVQRADGFYCQFVTDRERREPRPPTGSTVGIDRPGGTRVAHVLHGLEWYERSVSEIPSQGREAPENASAPRLEKEERLDEPPQGADEVGEAAFEGSQAA